MENKMVENNNQMARASNKKKKEVFRVILNKRANDVLESKIEKINQNFEFGQVTKSDIANWVLERLEKKLSNSEISDIKESSFDGSRALQDVLKKSRKESSKLPKELELALKSHLGILASKKSTK